MCWRHEGRGTRPETSIPSSSACGSTAGVHGAPSPPHIRPSREEVFSFFFFFNSSFRFTERLGSTQTSQMPPRTPFWYLALMQHICSSQWANIDTLTEVHSLQQGSHSGLGILWVWTDVHAPYRVPRCPTSPVFCLFLPPPNPGQPWTPALSPERCPVRCPRAGMVHGEPLQPGLMHRAPSTGGVQLCCGCIAWSSTPRGRAAVLLPSLGSYECRACAFSQKETKPPSQNKDCSFKSGILVVTKTSPYPLPSWCGCTWKTLLGSPGVRTRPRCLKDTVHCGALMIECHVGSFHKGPQGSERQGHFSEATQQEEQGDGTPLLGYPQSWQEPLTPRGLHPRGRPTLSEVSWLVQGQGKSEVVVGLWTPGGGPHVVPSKPHSPGRQTPLASSP